MKIRKFYDNDAKEVAELIRRNDKEISSLSYPKEVIELWDKQLSPKYIIKISEGRMCYVMVDKTNIIGYVSIEGNKIKKLFVNPDYHKKGIGSKLLNKVENIAKKNNLNLLIVDSNIHAERFYVKKGFKKIKNKFSKVGNQKIKLIYMEKILK